MWREQDGQERESAALEEEQAARAVRVRRDQVQVQPRHAPEKAAPDEQAVVPAQQEELEDRQADEDEVDARPGKAEAAAGGDVGIPGRDRQCDLLPPEQVSDDQTERQQADFNHDRVAQRTLEATICSNSPRCSGRMMRRWKNCPITGRIRAWTSRSA